MKKIAVTMFFILLSRMAFSENEISFDCQTNEYFQSENFNLLQMEAERIDRKLCKSFLTIKLEQLSISQESILEDFEKFTRTEANQFSRIIDIQQFNRPFNSLRKSFSNEKFDSLSLPSFSVEIDQVSEYPDKYNFYFADNTEHASFSKSDVMKCEEKFKVDCFQAMKEFGAAFNNYKVSYSKLSSEDTYQKLKKLSSDWDDFLESRRSQTFIDLAFTTWKERKHLQQGHLVGPPQRQWVALHPTFVYENVSDDANGNRDKSGVAVEWIGLNWWNKETSPVKFPFGVSIASTYTDRVDVDNVGHGLMFHFFNKYSIGWSRRDDSDGFYFSLDLLKAFENKSLDFEKFKSKMKKI